MDIGIFGARGVPSTYGGYETFLTTLAPALVERGHSVTVYCRADATGGTQTWRGVQCKVLPSIAGKNSSTLSHGLTSSIAAFRAHHDVVLAVNVANAAFCGAIVAGGASVVLAEGTPSFPPIGQGQSALCNGADHGLGGDVPHLFVGVFGTLHGHSVLRSRFRLEPIDRSAQGPWLETSGVLRYRRSA